MSSEVRRNRLVRHILPAAAVLIAALGLAPAGGQAQSGQSLDQVEQKLEKERKRQKALDKAADRLEAETRDLRQKMIRAARRTQEREALISTLEVQYESLRDELRERRSSLQDRRLQLSQTLGALTTMSRDPRRAFFLFPGTPKQSVQSSILLQSAIPALRDRADLLRDELAALTNVQADLAEKLDELSRAEGELVAERQTLDALLAEKAKKAKQTEAARDKSRSRVAKLVKEAKDLRDLMNRLNRPVPKPAPEAATEAEHAKVNAPGEQLAARPPGRPTGLRDFPASPEAGAFSAPAAGRVIRRYGQDLGYGQTAKGVTIRTRDAAQVVAPFDGKIAFAGSFRDHGLILIIQHSGGYHTVLAGFARVNVVEGQWLLAGEPVGIMSAATSGDTPELYVELRRGGQPINPLKWIKTGSIKVHG